MKFIVTIGHEMLNKFVIIKFSQFECKRLLSILGIKPGGKKLSYDEFYKDIFTHSQVYHPESNNHPDEKMSKLF